MYLPRIIKSQRNRFPEFSKCSKKNEDTEKEAIVCQIFETKTISSRMLINRMHEMQP